MMPRGIVTVQAQLDTERVKGVAANTAFDLHGETTVTHIRDFGAYFRR